MPQINVRNLSNENEDGAPKIESTPDFSATSYMVPPVGTTAQRPTNPQGGDLRFNTDTASLEYFKGDTLGWTQIEMTSPDLGGGTGSNVGVGARGLIALRYQPSTSNEINYLTISTLGNTQDFGDLTGARKWGGTAASRTRGIWAGGNPSATTMDYVTISTTGNAIDFGDRTGTNEIDGLSTETRGVFAGGYSTPSLKNIMEYITIASTGNAQDFGDLLDGRGSQGQMGGASSTRGLWAGGQRPSVNANTIEYITVASTGNSIDFGDIIQSGTNGFASASSSTKMYLIGGSQDTDIGVITISTLGNEVDFGGDSGNSQGYMGAVGSQTRGIAVGGGPSLQDRMDYIDYATAGDAKDFGDLGTASSGNKGLSNAHGGL